MKWIVWGLIIMHQGLKDWLHFLNKLEILTYFMKFWGDWHSHATMND